MTTEPQQVAVPTESTGLAEKEALRLVLFGLPAAGKSSLLGALLQASDAQPVQLKGTIDDRSRRLEELRQRVYFSNQPTRTVEEVVPYPVEYRPMPLPGEQPGEPLPAILIDCDGQVAIDLLRRRQSLTELSAERALAKAILEADALMLIIDASAPVKQMESDFEEFARFLAQMELSRGARTDVGGLPVFLVLTKCDLLVHPALPREQWQKQIEERQRYVGERFKNFIRRRKSEQEKRTFGVIDLYQAATATGQPPFSNAGAKPREPFGVGSLFQQAFHQAALYRERRRAARRRMYWTIGLGGTVLGLLLGLLLALLFFPSSPFIPDPSTPSQRLAGTLPQLEERLKQMIALRDGPEFHKLPSLKREEVLAHLQELEDYLAYYRKVMIETGWPGVIESAAELQKVRDKLTNDLAPHPGWEKTAAAQLQADYRRDADAMLDAAETARKWYQRVGDRMADLWAFRNENPPIDWRLFQERSDAALAEASTPPFNEKDPLRKGVAELTWANVLRIDTVKRAHDAEEKARRQLTQVRHIAAALGLVALGMEYPDVLNIPRGITSEQIVQRVAALRKAYPNYMTEFAAGELPDVARQEISKRADQNYRDLLTPARAAILRYLQANGGDTPAGWSAVRAWLQTPKELAEWRTLAGALNRLRLPPPPDPITELTTFLDARSFTITLPASVEVDIPLSLELAPKSGEPLEVTLSRGGETVGTITLQPEEDGVSKDAAAGLLRCVFRASGNRTLDFRPGDDVSATLPLKGGKTMTWKSGNRSAQYTFERLSLPPRVDGRVESGITLRLLGTGNRLPTVPDLLPEVPPR
jgi:GTPase SAR1 family protein